MKIITYINRLNLYLFILLAMVMMNYRALIVDRIYGKYTLCEGCFKAWVLSTDAWIVLFIVILLVFSLVLKSYLLRVIFRVLVFSIIGYYLIDLYLFKFLNQRLYLIDVQKYFDLEVFTELFNRDTGAYAIPFLITFLVFTSIYLLLHNRLRFNIIDKTVTTMVVLVLCITALTVDDTDYVNSTNINSIITINLKSGSSTDYSAATIKQSLHKLQEIERLTCKINGQNNKKNIILLVIESLSIYQSKLLSGIEDLTPNLDKIAQEHHYFTNFFANNFTSMEGRMALLTGEKTFRDIAKLSFDRGRVGYWNSQRNIPTLLNSYGYHTSFLDGANLNFTQTGKFMKGIGFDYVEGQEYIGYKDEPRFGFNSVPDKVLYNRVLKYIQTVEQPFFTTIITVTTHPPYIDPETKLRSIEKATKYADATAYEFYQGLIKQNFFDNGILIITSDHRSMTPVLAEEMAKYGKQAAARIPLIIVDKDYSGEKISHEYLQQSDLLNSLEYLVADTYCHRQDEGNILSTPPKPSQCIYHNRGDYRDRIDVYCDNGTQSATVRLSGDNTDIIEGSLSNKDEVLNFIAISRIGARARHKEFLKE